MKRFVRFVSMLMALIMVLTVIDPFSVRAEDTDAQTEAVVKEETAAGQEDPAAEVIAAQPDEEKTDAAEAAEEPAAEIPAEPEKEEPAAETPAEPEKEEPAAATPAEPEKEEPAAETPDEPEKEEPAAVTPADPEKEEPAAETPAEPEKEEPAAETPAEPEKEEPAEETPAEPEKEEPAEETPAEPEKEEPAAEKPAEPDKESENTGKKGTRGGAKSGNILTLQLDQEVHVTGEVQNDKVEEAVILSFTPEEDGEYYFYSYDFATDPYAFLYDGCDADRNLIGENDDGGESNNFGLLATLTAGTTYYLYATVFETGTIDYKVKVVIPTYISITLNASGGYFDSEEQTEITQRIVSGSTDPRIFQEPTPPVGGVYYFSGWTLTEGGTEILQDLSQLVDGDVLYAVWEDAVRVTFYSTLGYFSKEEIDGEMQYTIVDSFWTQKGCPTRGPEVYNDEGLIFAGWSLEENSDEIIAFSSYAINGDTDFYAVWREAGAFPALSLGQQTQVDKPYGTPVWFCFTAEEDGWYVFVSENADSGDPYGELYSEDMTFIMSDDNSNRNNNFRIEYQLSAGETICLKADERNEGSASYTVKVDKGMPITLDASGGYFEDEEQTTLFALALSGDNGFESLKTPQNTNRAMRFLGWTFTEGGTEADAVWEDLEECSVLYAVWSQPLQLLLDVETPVSGEVLYDRNEEAVFLAFTPEEDGDYYFYSYDYVIDPYAFLLNSEFEQIGYNDDGGEENNFAFTITLSAGETYYLGATICGTGVIDYKVKVEKVNGIHITLDASGGYFEPDGQETIQATILPGITTLDNLTVPVPSVGGKSFAGWTRTKGGTEADADISQLSEGDTLYAVWVDVVRITFHATRGFFSYEIDEETGEKIYEKETGGLIKIGETTGAPSIKNDQGLIFVGWSLSEESNDIISLGDYRIYEDTNFYAVWSDTSEVPELVLEETAQVDNPAGSPVWFRFTAEEAGWYIFVSDNNGSSDPIGYLYDADMSGITDDDEGNGNMNFRILARLEDGESCYLRADEYHGKAASYTVIVHRAMVITVDANGGYYDNDGEQAATSFAYCYNTADFLRNAPLPQTDEEDRAVHGWAVNADAEKPNVTEETELTDGTILYAVWGKDISNHYIDGRIDTSDYDFYPEYGGSAERHFVYYSSHVGEDELTYQWYVSQQDEGNDTGRYVMIDGATESSYIVENVTYMMDLKLTVTDIDGFAQDFYTEVGVNTGLWISVLSNYRTCVEKGGSETVIFEPHIDLGEVRTEIDVNIYDEASDYYLPVDTIENATEYKLENIQADYKIACRAMDEYGGSTVEWVYVYCGGHVIKTETGYPTCTNSVSHGRVYCERCGMTIKDGTYMEALGHDFGAWEVLYEATEEQAGIMRRVCLRDPDHVETREYFLGENMLTVTYVRLDENGNIAAKWDAAYAVDDKVSVLHGETVAIKYWCDPHYRVSEMRWGGYGAANTQI
ncbi:MAG: InlB B-repeat-containing protein, partial [Lachnospiraceae bacterium]|nr:InlB B-repeat-containing protein [Lachnospiraceae bacterium]